MLKHIALIALTAGAASAALVTIDASTSAGIDGSVTGINDGFGGVIGAGATLDVIADAATGDVTITINRGGGSWNDAAVIYIDAGTGGFASTDSLGDLQDGGRSAISHGGLTFASGFDADYAIAMEATSHNLFGLAAGGNGSLSFLSNVGGGTGNADAAYSVSFNIADLGLSLGDSFDIVVTYLNQGNGFRSNEFIGVGSFAGGNPGNNPVALGTDDFITVVVPAPGAMALLGLGGLAAARPRRA